MSGDEGRAPMRRVVLVLATSAGGTGRHVGELAAGLATLPRPGPGGLLVTVAAPAETLAALELPPDVARAELAVATRPSPRRDLATVLALRRLAADADAVHAHGVRAGALAVLAGQDPAAPAGGGRDRAQCVGRRAGSACRPRRAHLGRRAGSGRPPRGLGRPRRRVARPWCPQCGPRPGARPAAARAVQQRTGRCPGAGRPRRTDGTALLLTVARLAPQKGLDVLAEALRAVAARRPDLPLLAVVAGEGPLEQQLQRAAGAGVAAAAAGSPPGRRRPARRRRPRRGAEQVGGPAADRPGGAAGGGGDRGHGRRRHPGGHRRRRPARAAGRRAGPGRRHWRGCSTTPAAAAAAAPAALARAAELPTDGRRAGQVSALLGRVVAARRSR